VLTAYETQTQRLLQNPKAPNPLYATSDIDSWINTARGQLAGEGECIRAQGSLVLTQGVNLYSFASITFPTSSSVSGIQGVINVRTAMFNVASGLQWMRPRPFEWFSFYELNSPVYLQTANQGPPAVWAQYGQGVNGTIYVSPVPDQTYTISADCVCYPINLVSDSTVEAIPYLWTDAVPFFAAYFALLSAQVGQRQAEADRMFQRYQEFVNRARRFATPSVLPGLYPQQANPTRANQLGVGGGGNQ